MKSNFFSCLSIADLNSIHDGDVANFTIPNVISIDKKAESMAASTISVQHTPLYDCTRSSKFGKVIGIMAHVLRFVSKLKANIGKNNSYNDDVCSYNQKALEITIKEDQYLYFAEIHNYFDSTNKQIKSIPALVTQLNIYRDDVGILRVKCKLKSWGKQINYPILLSKHSHFSRLLVFKVHNNLSHGGVYSVLSELRKNYWIPAGFSFVKKTLRECIICRRLHARPIKINQNSYRDFRLQPAEIPYRDLFIDYIGPISIFANGTNTKVYLLILTCLWSRSVNLQVCTDMTVKSFLRAFQLHLFSFGAPERVYSDLGSNLVAGTKAIADYIKDIQTQSFFTENNIKPMSFKQYAKGCSKLGSLVESCVKIVKKLIYGSIRSLILNSQDFEFLIAQVIHLINRRPIAFKEALRDCNANEQIPLPITPEMLVKGYELVSLNIVPELHPTSSDDPDWNSLSKNITGHIKNSMSKLNKARSYLNEKYNEQFLPQLIQQAINVKDRYKPVSHKLIKVNDIVLLKEPMLKPSNYLMGIVSSVTKNSVGEITDAMVRKGSTRETVHRHIETIIPLLEYSDNTTADSTPITTTNVQHSKPSRSRRAAAVNSEAAVRRLIANGSI